MSDERIKVALPPDLRRAIEAYCEQMRMPISAYLAHAALQQAVRDRISLGPPRALPGPSQGPNALHPALPACTATGPSQGPPRAQQPAVIRTSGRLTEGQPLRGAPSTWTEEGPAWDGEIADAIAEKRARRRPTSGPIKDEHAWRDRVEADLRAGPPGKVRELARAWHHRQAKAEAAKAAATAELRRREELDRVEREELARRAEELRRRRGATRTETGSGSTQSGGNGSRVESGRAKRLEPG